MHAHVYKGRKREPWFAEEPQAVEIHCSKTLDSSIEREDGDYVEKIDALLFVWGC